MLTKGSASLWTRRVIGTLGRVARRTLVLVVFGDGAPGRMADLLGQVLRERAKAGVRVFVLYDAFGTVDIPVNHRNDLRAAGVIVEPFRPIRFSTLHLAQNRSHLRGIVIDSRIGWTGGFGSSTTPGSVLLEAFRRRSWIQRIAEWGSTSLTRLL